MKKLNELETELRDKRKALGDLIDLRDTEAREFTAEEATRFDTLHGEVESLITDIDREKVAENVRKQRAIDSAPTATPEEKLQKRFSFVKGMKAMMAGRPLEGVEAEASQEAEIEKQRSGAGGGISGIGVPGFFLNVRGKNVVNGYLTQEQQDKMQQRDLTIGGAATGAELVPTDMVGHIYGLRIEPKVISLGATTLLNLSGNQQFSKSGVISAVWATENATATEATPATSTFTMSPKRLAATVDVSRTLMLQRPEVAEPLVKTELQSAINVALDVAAINGAGGSDPTGILGLTDVLVTALGANGATPTRADLIAVWTAMAAANSDMLNEPSWLTTPGIKAYLWNLNVDAGSGRFVWENDRLIGYAATTSNNVPSTLTKGASGAICHAMILGNWPQLYIGNWGGLDIVVNPYTKSKENIVEFTVNTNWDINARHDEAFSVIIDALTA